MADVITTLHPEDAPEDNLFPNIKKENLPSDFKIKFQSSSILGLTTQLTTSTELIQGTEFTITETCIVTATLTYSNTPPKEIAIITTGSYYACAIATSQTVNFGRLRATAILEPGTYAIMASSRTAGSNGILVDKFELTY